MSANDPIKILHLTDSHIKDQNKDDLKMRVNALTTYLNANKVEIDIVVFTGDLTFSGKSSEYELFERFVAGPIRTQLRIHSSKFLIIPGNHDVDRDRVTVPENCRLRKFDSSQLAEAELRKISEPWPRLSAFAQYQESCAPTSSDYAHTPFAGSLYSTRRINNLKGVNLGFALLNSAWLCADDNDQGSLFLTEKQVNDVAESLRNCDLRIALCHHPKDWFHYSETDLSINDLHREFSLIFTGHLHKPVSTQEIDTTGNSIALSARALFDGKKTAEVDDGFHIYSLDIPGRKLTVQFKKYIRKRNTFDKDTDHANDGECTYDLSLPISLTTSSSLLVQRLSGEATKLEKEVRETLSRLQGVDNPVFVQPKVRSFVFRRGTRKTEKDDLSMASLLDGNVVITGDKDSGKSILLKTLTSQFHMLRSKNENKAAAVYLPSIPASDWKDQAELLKHITSKVQEDYDNLNGMHLTIIVDGIRTNQSKRLETLAALCNAHGWNYIASIDGFDVVNILCQEPAYQAVLFAEVRPWGPSRIREFTTKLFEGSALDPDVAYRTIRSCLEAVDIPSNPSIISLYVSVFASVGSKLSNLSFLRLLEKIEQLKLGVDEAGTIDSMYNRQRVLMRFSVECLNRGDIAISQGRALEIIEQYFKPSKLKVHSEEFLLFLVKSGILNPVDDTVEFSNYVFWDYYLAQAFKDGLLAEADFTNSISKCARVTSALSLFAGMRRENLELAERTLAMVEKEFTGASKLELKDLDKHISGLMLDEHRSANDADKVVQEAYEEAESPAVLDMEYERQRQRVANNRKRLMERGLDESFDDLSSKIAGLHAFYSVLRNLENIDATRKEEMLDRILDFHISTNFDLIDFYFQYSNNEQFRTFAAYMLTWTGHGFMAASLGNPTMSDSIIAVSSRSTNDFKRLLLLLLLSQVGDENACKLIRDFMESCDSRAANEILFVHVRRRLVEHQGRKLPLDLMELFKKLFVVRQTRYGGAKSEAEAKGQLAKALSAVKVEHLQQWIDREASTPIEEVNADGDLDVLDI